MSRGTVKLTAAIVWVGGAIVLYLKAASLLAQAQALAPGEYGLWLAAVIALLIGAIKARYLFSGFCRKNLDRIAALQRPRPWHAFRPQFYAFLIAMILLGATLSRLAVGSYPALVAVAMLDISIATALLGSALVFRTHRQVAG